ncbi:hypothetical protein ESZ53_01610 [Salinibacterium sp. UTAS2018]|uniref:hypothetical protein n=1 Tax=Salinibacterium sp. UTAS2018 TaxID=2508880 RepID=UPI0010096019|nr:hypothetical protein [Salinibacterium sp. UTAS2018]QAV69251.1 hypothetical protein ESZ53_01610 [Salinibacterium sp. UTAS2018]
MTDSASGAEITTAPSRDETSARGRPSLIAGRSNLPLDDRQIRIVAETFSGFDYQVPFRYEDTARTSFRVEVNEFGNEEGIVVVGRDVFPGASIIDPNSALSMKAAVAHEISHYYRWKDQTEFPELEYEYLDEALTSLDASLRFPALSPHELKQLVLDAIQRIQIYRSHIHGSAAGNPST